MEPFNAALPPQDRRDQTPSNALRIVLANMLVCVAIAVFLWLVIPAFSSVTFIDVLVHSEVIGTIACILILSFRHLFTGVEGAWRALQFVAYPLIVLFSYVVGTLVARLIIGAPFSLQAVFGGHAAMVSLATTVTAAFLGSLFFVTREQLGRLKLRAAQEEQRAATAQLAMLRAQIEPHMLFNTLANLRALISVDPDRAVTMLDRLNDFLRATLYSSGRLSQTLAHEFEILTNYLELMKIRLGSRLTYEIDLPHELAQISVPSLLLQPVVENAIKHGIEPAVSGGHIRIRAQIKNTDAGAVLELSVLDTGIGFQSSAGSAAQPGGFGLHSLRERLALRAQHRATVEVESPPAGLPSGTIVVIRMPQ